MKTASDVVCTIAADDKLVHDAFALTTDDAGRPVVSGPGYVRTLIDDNQDGVFEKAVDWQRVEQGAQGLWREGNELYYVADGGVWRSTDSNGDLKADGRPEKLLSVPTGGEHDAHAIRRGPDGYWYLTNGNFSTANMRALLNDKDSPISEPKMGCIWRVSPDFKTRSVWAHGLRNTYDFDFLPNGELVTYDSDEEREMSLPAYNPTRVYAVTPGTDGGWVSQAWIENDSNQLMPLNLASLGRGSPTGVCVYQHDALGSRFRDAVLVLDWTFGRVIAVFPERKNEDNNAATVFLQDGLCKWEVIMEPAGTGGFAPTDITIDHRGDVLIVTGGRGTVGTLYRLSGNVAASSAAKSHSSNLVLVSGDSKENVVGGEQDDAPDISQAAPATSSTANLAVQFYESDTKELNESRSANLRTVLLAPCPWEAWSRSKWLRTMNDEVKSDLLSFLAGRIQAKISSGVDEGALRLRAAQVLVHIQAVIPGADLRSAITSASDDLNLAAVWYALGRGKIAAQQSDIQAIYDAPISQPGAGLEPWQQVFGSYTCRCRWEAIGLRRWDCPSETSFESNNVLLKKSNTQIQLWALSRQSKSSMRNDFVTDTAKAAYLPSSLPVNRVDAAAFDRLAQAIRNGQFKTDPAEIILALAFVQKSLGDPRATIDGSRNVDAASILDGYRSQRFDAVPQNIRTGWAKYCLNLADAAKEQQHFTLEEHAVRTAAMFRCDVSEVLDRLLQRIDAESHPTADVNTLCAIAASAFKPNSTQSQLIANAFAGVSEKIAVRGLPTDNRWSTRMQQLLESFSSSDPRFVANLIGTLRSSKGISLEWIEWLPLQQQREAASLVAKQMVASDPTSWTSSQIQVVGRFVLPAELAAKIRSTAESWIDSPLRKQDLASQTDSSNVAELVEFLAKTPTTADYDVFLLATSSPDRLLLKHGWSGLRKLPIADAKREGQAVALLMAAQHVFPIDGVDTNQIVSRIRNIAARLKISTPPSAQANWETWQAYLQPLLVDNGVKLQWDELQKPQASWTDLVKAALPIAGDEDRGAILFKRGQCNQCHNSSKAIGPSLDGVTRRFSYEDLFRAVYEPSRDVSDRFRATKILTVDGQIIVGMITVDNEKEVILTTSDGTSKRVAIDDIEERSESTQSLMPENLLQGWNSDQLADLYAYLKTL